jgi:hypothetical protein
VKGYDQHDNAGDQGPAVTREKACLHSVTPQWLIQEL